MKFSSILLFTSTLLVPAVVSTPTGFRHHNQDGDETPQEVLGRFNFTREGGLNKWQDVNGGHVATLDALAKLDLNGDGTIDLKDLLELAQKYSDYTVDGDGAIEVDASISARDLDRRAKQTTTGASLRQQMIAYHNAWRAHHGAPAMTWSDTLAAAALKSATKCVFQHTSGNPYGENIAAGSYNNPAYYAYLWYNEVNSYNFNSPGFAAATGHFTQLAWKNSRQLGCAFVGGCTGAYPYMLFCEYSPAGNVLPASNFATNVGRPQSKPVNPTVPPQTINNFKW